MDGKPGRVSQTAHQLEFWKIQLLVHELGHVGLAHATSIQAKHCVCVCAFDFEVRLQIQLQVSLSFSLYSFLSHLRAFGSAEL